MPLLIKTAARSSQLSRAQVNEVEKEIRASCSDVIFEPLWVETTGDKDVCTSLRTLEKTDFFTKEIDALILEGICRIAIHAAKDLPDPLPEGLVLAALTKGLDSSDSLVLREGETLQDGAIVGTSSERREEAVLQLGKRVSFLDIRGTIEQRLSLLDQRKVDGVVVAEAALIRLKLNYLNRIKLPGSTAAFQGQLAVVVRSDDCEMISLFSRIDARAATLYLGTDITHFLRIGKVIHCPLIQVRPKNPEEPALRSAYADFDEYTHVIFTSKNAVRILLEHMQVLGLPPKLLSEKKRIAIGKVTAKALERHGFPVFAIAEEETQEGVIALLREENLDDAYVFLPGSSLSRPQLHHFLTHEGIRHQVCPIYDTAAKEPEILPNLRDIRDIIFTSPSTVHAFFQYFSELPKTIRLGVLGPVTEKALKNYLKEEMEIFYV